VSRIGRGRRTPLEPAHDVVAVTEKRALDELRTDLIG